MGLWNNVPIMAESRKQLISKPFRKNEMAIKKTVKKVRIIEPRPIKTDLKVISQSGQILNTGQFVK